MPTCSKQFIYCLILTCLLFSCKKKEEPAGEEEVAPQVAAGGVLVTDTGRYIGLNYNESLQEIRTGELSTSKTKWVRGFLDVFAHYDNQDLNTNAKIVKYLTLKDLGYKTVLNLKFNFMTRPYPAVNSTAWNNYISFIDNILDRVRSTAVLSITSRACVPMEPVEPNMAILFFKVFFKI